MKLQQFLLLSLLTIGAVFVHGYHPWAEDAEIYVPGIEKQLHPQLFPFNAQFFESHAHLTLFPNFVAALVRLTHLRLEWVLFLLQLASIFLLLWGCWEICTRCFTQPYAQWAGVALIAALLTLPVAGTALYVMDQYFNPRNLVAFPAVFAVVKVLDGKYFQALLFLVFAALFHPLMSVFAFSLCIVLIVMRRLDLRAAACLLPFGISLSPPPPAYHQVALSHAYHYFLRWQWYELLGAFAPVLILWWFSRIARPRQLKTLDLLCLSLVVYEVIYLPPAIVLSSSRRFEALARLQPMRCLYLLYILFFLFIGGLMGQFFLKNRPLRWLALFLPLCAGMFYAQRSLFPESAHIEWPGAESRNPWAQAFRWIQDNTPADAIFALDPYSMDIAGEDENGFRAIAERSMLADATKDTGAVSMFPLMADEWHTQVEAEAGWNNFKESDFRRLQARYGVAWLVLQRSSTVKLNCPYQNPAVEVCHLN